MVQNVQRWANKLRMFMMKNKVIGKPSVMSDDFVQSIDQKICERGCFTISEVSHELA
jgi:hypothetical protein